MQEIKTEFNSNKATLERVDIALRGANVAALNKNMMAWFDFLGQAFKEAVVKMSEEQEAEFMKEYEKLEQDVGVLAYSRKINTANLKVDNDLLRYEIKIRRFLNDKGMLLSDKQDDGGM